MSDWVQTSRSINQPLRVLFSLTIGDIFGLLVIFGVLQLVTLVLGIEPILNVVLLFAMTGLLVLFRYKDPNINLMDVVHYKFHKINGGLVYEPTTQRERSISRTQFLDT